MTDLYASAPLPASPDYLLTINGHPVTVIETSVGSIASVEIDARSVASDPLAVRVSPQYDVASAIVRPLSRGITASVEDGSVVFVLTRPGPVSVECNDDLRRPLLLFVQSAAATPTIPDGPGVIRLEGGRVHDLGRVELTSGQTLYLEAGAVFRGNIVAHEAENVTIAGPGIIDGSSHSRETAQNNERLVHLIACRGVRVSDVTLVEGQTWQIMPYGCTGVAIRNVKIVSGANSDDGIDVVSSHDVVIDDCFIRTKDDCVVLKGFPDFHEKGMQSVEDVLVRDSVFWNAEWGNGLEIGYETRVPAIRNVTFRNCDVIHCEAERYGSGGTLTIHNGDRAVVEEILYEDIRVEDAQEKLVDFKICHDRYSKDDERGQIRNVTLRRVRVTGGRAPVSIVQGFDSDHIPEGLVFEDVEILGEPVSDPQTARLVTEKARGIRFLVGGETTWKG